MTEPKWTRRSLRQLSARREHRGHLVSHQTVGRLLLGLDDALHVNAKKREAGEGHPDRNAQFAHMTRQRENFTTAGLPIISVDTKKKERIGPFKNAGGCWSREPEAVNVHDFRSEAVGRAVPYGIDDLPHKRGTLVVGTSADPPEFAGEAIARWWDSDGVGAFPRATEVLILADAGGSNGCRPRLWKQHLQEQLCDQRGLTVTVGHYPTGGSKGNPIEQRLFGPISLNWAGKPLHTWETILAYLRGTTPTTGLEVSAVLDNQTYEAGRTVADRAMQALNLEHHLVCPNWNYTLGPRATIDRDHVTAPTPRELVL